LFIMVAAAAAPRALAATTATRASIRGARSRNANATMSAYRIRPRRLSAALCVSFHHACPRFAVSLALSLSLSHSLSLSFSLLLAVAVGVALLHLSR